VSPFSESTAELAALEWLHEIGYSVTFGPGIAPGEAAAERGGYEEVALFHKRKPQRVLILVLCIGI
jgi:type I restriction enzyme, R subunit